MDISSFNEKHWAFMDTVTSDMDLVLILLDLFVVAFEGFSHGKGGSEGTGGVFKDPKGVFEFDTLVSSDDWSDTLKSSEFQVHTSLGTEFLFDLIKLPFVHKDTVGSKVGCFEEAIELVESVRWHHWIMSGSQLHKTWV